VCSHIAIHQVGGGEGDKKGGRGPEEGTESKDKTVVMTDSKVSRERVARGLYYRPEKG